MIALKPGDMIRRPLNVGIMGVWANPIGRGGPGWTPHSNWVLCNFDSVALVVTERGGDALVLHEGCLGWVMVYNLGDVFVELVEVP